MAYATVSDVQARMTRQMTQAEQTVCSNLLEDAAVIVDAYNSAAAMDAKELVSVRMVTRAIGDGTDAGIPMGATQGSMSALGYSQSWTIGAGSAGELYLGRLEKKLLGACNNIGSRSPIEPIPLAEVTLCEG